MKLTKNNIAIIEGDTHISEWVKASGRLDHDQNMLPGVLEYIKHGDVVVDAGAYIGDHTIAYAEKVTTAGAVFAFEPNRTAFECLEYNMKRYPQVSCFNQGLGDKTGRMGVVVDNKNVGMSYLSAGNDVSITSIDELEMFHVDFIKIDVEGFELDILLGAKATINRFKPKMLIEINEATLKRVGISRKYIYDLLEGWGYTIQNIYSAQSLNESQMDIICLPK